MKKWYRKDYSEASHQPFPRRELIYMKRKFSLPPAENRLSWSSYHATYWACDATDSGLISVGPYADENRVSYDMEDNVTENGEQTWEGSGIYRTLDGLDVSSATTVAFSIKIGGYQQSSTQEFTVTCGFCNEAGDSFQPIVTMNVLGEQRIPCVAQVSDITEDTQNLCFYASVVPSVSDGQWYAIDATLEFDVDFPGLVAKTAGESVVRSVETRFRTANKIHKSEWEKVQEDYEGIVTPREGQDQGSFVVPVGDV